MIRLDLPLVIDATFCAGAGMIAYGAVLGKTTPTQLTWLMVGMVCYHLLGLLQLLDLSATWAQGRLCDL